MHLNSVFSFDMTSFCQFCLVRDAKISQLTKNIIICKLTIEWRLLIPWSLVSDHWEVKKKTVCIHPLLLIHCPVHWSNAFSYVNLLITWKSIIPWQYRKAVLMNLLRVFIPFSLCLSIFVSRSLAENFVFKRRALFLPSKKIKMNFKARFA